jgi:very-short-patch-repair endonuclease
MDPLRPIPIGKKLAIARQLRREPTPPERLAWSLLRNRRLLGLKFRRQHVLHGFIVDFYCPALKLVLELDGNHHDEATQTSYDDARTARLESAGYRLIRVRNRDLTPESVEELIGQVLRTTARVRVPPLPKGEGDRG